MSLAHAEVNTGRLLERVIDAAPGLELIEIEGDAAFLYREVGSTAPDELVAEVHRLACAMHPAFHLEREYVARNLCPCSGCKEAANLTLKFVAHVGDVATQTIRRPAQARRDRRHPGAPDAEEPGPGPGVRAALRGPLRDRRVHRVSAGPRDLGRAGGHRLRPGLLRRRHRARPQGAPPRRRRPGVAAWGGRRTRRAPDCRTCSAAVVGSSRERPARSDRKARRSGTVGTVWCGPRGLASRRRTDIAREWSP